MKTIQQIEKRRRELRRINYFLIYLLAMTIFGMFFFIDEFTGMFGALKYNIFLRFYFISFVVAFLFYLAQKEKQQAKLTRELIKEMSQTSNQLVKELRHKTFLSENSFLITNLRDRSILKQLFLTTLKFFQADGGAVVLRNRGSGWGSPLVVYPENVGEQTIVTIIDFINKTGRSLLQPDPEYPTHKILKNTKNALAVPLRLEGRLFGLIAFWSDRETPYDQSDLDMLEVIAREAAGSAFTIELLQDKSDQFNGLLSLVAKATDDRVGAKGRAAKTAHQAKVLAKQLQLPQETIEALEIATMLRDVDKIVGNGREKHNGSGNAAHILETLKFPKRVTEILAVLANMERGAKAKIRASKDVKIAAGIIRITDDYFACMNSARGRGRAPASVINKLADSGKPYDPLVLDELRQLLAPESFPVN